MADISNLGTFLGDVANAIREKKGTQEQIPAASFDTEIKNIKTGELTEEEYNRCVGISSDILGKSLSQYTPVEYLASSGTQYIDMEYIPTNTTVVEIDFEKTGELVDYERLLGVKDYFEILRSNNRDIFEYKINATGNSAQLIQEFGPINAGERHTVKCGNMKFYFDNELIKDYSETFTTDKSMYLFYANNADRYGQFKVYSVNIYEGTSIMKSLIPCLDIDKIPCFYDKIGNKFYYNSGSGTFDFGEVLS